MILFSDNLDQFSGLNLICKLKVIKQGKLIHLILRYPERAEGTGQGPGTLHFLHIIPFSV